MQTVFLVWLPGLGALFAGGGAAVWLTGKAWEAIARARAITGRNRLVLDQARLLKEIEGSSVVLPDDITRRIDRHLAEVEAITRKELT